MDKKLYTNIQESIAFHSEGISFALPAPDQTKQWIGETIQAEQQELEQLSFIFCSDEYLHKINVEYLQHDTYTDVITFPYAEEWVEGDIFISVERIRENAQQYNVAPDHELHRVIIHGVLHLLGYGDKTPEEKEVMTTKEDFYLKKLQNIKESLS